MSNCDEEKKIVTQVCITCLIEKDETEFAFRNKKIGKRHYRCRSCYAKYRQEHDKKERKGTKVCLACGIEKSLPDDFNKDQGKCKPCQYVYDKEYVATHQQEIIAYREATKDHKKEVADIRYQANKEAILAKGKEWRDNNKEWYAEYSKNWIINNKEKHKKTAREYTRRQRRENPVFKLRSLISTRIGGMLRANDSSKKSMSVMSFLPYSIEELKSHLENQFEPWMSWGNYGRYHAKTFDNNPTWQIDHIVPQSDLHFSSMEDDSFKKCWALENLRPLSAKQNLLDGVNRTRHKKKHPIEEIKGIPIIIITNEIMQ